MKIGIFDPYLDSLSGGEKYMLAMAKCLSFRHEVFIFWDPLKEEEIREKAKDKLGIDLSSIKFHPNIFSNNVSFLSRLKSSKQYDLMVVLSDGSIPLVLPKLYLHFQFPTEWVKRSYIDSLKLKKVSRVFCNSFFTKEYIDKKFRIDSIVLYPPVYIPVLGNLKKENVILNVGRFGLNPDGSNYKKQDFLINVFKRMVDKGLRKWRFVLVIGVDEKNRDKLLVFKEQAEGYPISFIENPDNNILWENYKKSKIYWHAAGFGEDLAKHPEYAEHFGISTVEAMGVGVVPVVINEGGQKEIVKNGESGFLWNTMDELVSNTERLIRNENLLHKMSKAAVERSKAFSGDRFCKELSYIVFEKVQP